jgi:hypothetical protein
MVEDGPVVRFANGTAALLRLTTGAWEPLGRASLLRQRDPLDDRGTTDLVLVDGARLSLLQKSSDGGLDPRRADVGDAGVINEVFAMTPEWFLVVTDTAVSAWEVGNTGVTALTPLPSPAAAPLPSRSRGVAGGFTLDGGAGPVGAFLAQTVDDAGMARVSGYVVTGAVSATGPFSANVQSTIAGFSPCPGDAALQQLSLAADTNGTSSALARCALSPSSVPVLASLPTGPGGVVQYAPFFEDQLPYRWDIVPQRTGLSVRAHAAANGLAWRADPAQNLQPAGNAPVRPVFLDRTPTALIMVPQRGPGITSRSRLYAEAAGRMLVEDPAGGLVAQLKAPEGQPLGTVAQSNRLFVAAEGVFDTSTANPRLVARAPAGVLFTAPASAASTEVTLGRARKLVLVASADSLYSADISDALANGFAQPAVFSRVFVPVPGVDLRSMTLGPADAGVSGYITTNTANLRFSTRDLLGWALTPVPSPDPRSASLPLRVWTEEGGGQARTGFSDGRVWSLPVMVPLTEPLTGTDGGALPVLDYGRLCGDLFAATPEGLHRARRAGDDGGLPRWERLDGLDAGLEPGVSDRSDLRLFEARDQQSQHLFVANSRGWLIEVLPTAPCP